MNTAHFALPLLLAGCTSAVPPIASPADASPAAPAAADDPLAQVGRWRLGAAIGPDNRPLSDALPQGKPVHVLVFHEKGQLGIEGGCNSIGGPYRIDVHGRLVIGPIVSTQRACADQARMAADAALMDLLQGHADWAIAESYPEQLHLDHANGSESRWTAVRPAR